MIYLICSILTSVLVVSYFKLFDRYRVNTFQAIVVNYLTCAIMGNAMSHKPVVTTAFWLEQWFPYTLILGCLFISVFYAISQTAQKIGVSVSMVAAKLSVAIPVCVALFAFNESITLQKILGIILSMVAVYFISKTNSNQQKGSLQLILPVLVFAGSGCIDTLLNFISQHFIPPFETNDILSMVFLTAFMIGSLALYYALFTGKTSFSSKSILWGVALGIPNYLCMYFLLKTLDSFKEASVVLPINNIGIVMCTTLVGMFFFKEQLIKINYWGLLIAICSIILLSL